VTISQRRLARAHDLLASIATTMHCVPKRPAASRT
jgi:hypothetical protein